MVEKLGEWTNQATASAFQNWVFEQTIPSYARSRDFPILSIINRMELGRYAHEELAVYAYCPRKEAFLRAETGAIAYPDAFAAVSHPLVRVPQRCRLARGNLWPVQLRKASLPEKVVTILHKFIIS